MNTGDKPCLRNRMSNRFLFVNADDTHVLTVTDGDASNPNSFKLAPRTMVYATCLGDSTNGADRLYFQSNYGVGGANAETCPDGCDAASPLHSSRKSALMSSRFHAARVCGMRSVFKRCELRLVAVPSETFPSNALQHPDFSLKGAKYFQQS